MQAVAGAWRWCEGDGSKAPAGHLEAPMTSPYPAREEPCWLPQVAETAPWAGSWASISERCGISRPCVEDQDGYTKTRSLQRSLQVQTLDNGFPRRQNNLIRSVDGPDGCLQSRAAVAASTTRVSAGTKKLNVGWMSGIASACHGEQLLAIIGLSEAQDILRWSLQRDHTHSPAD
ncbi:predicted protein [Histoplasma capsulatum G186AR]|uniref:Uncharacterized protein n=1 Tax=Ajellomyces capsulatus (strain G186AR / H82 / ATCC MYA-2454 / RMSCC 2432) TaxID=447093 RepID=C0NA57_AJECG|nr:uncharacterized protein HCBG_00003 [Histoplasma capsulatum G186AR]EEH10548.1 predicted protein [Histoplasma capsulatum G186AR]